MIEKGEVLD